MSNSYRAPRVLSNKFPGKCRYCREEVAAGAGKAEGKPGGPWRIACAECHAAGASDFPPIPMVIEEALSDILSDDPRAFLIFSEGKWKIALDFEWMQILVEGLSKRP